jgi:hypothetical protein
MMKDDSLLPSLVSLLTGPGTVLLTAPPAWGKTQLVLQLAAFYKKPLYLCPLRAVVEELKAHLPSELQGKLTLMTPEEYIYSKKNASFDLYIFDEAHLIWLWGESFREALLECWYELSLRSEPLLLLSGTLDVEGLLQKPWGLEERIYLNSAWHVDLGNYTLLFPPAKTYLFPPLCIYVLKILFCVEQVGATLLFVDQRSHVNRWVRWATYKKIPVLGCVGGEASAFVSALGKSHPRLIVATSVLSHGVNLPALKRVVIYGHKEPSKELLLQMIGRGGRKRETYHLWIVKPGLTLKQIMQSLWKLCS